MLRSSEASRPHHILQNFGKARALAM